jgi:hypothetical protein
MNNKKKNTFADVLFNVFLSSYSQCAWEHRLHLGTYTFPSCIGNTYNTAKCSAGQYALVNVLLGSTYRFTIKIFSNKTCNNLNAANDSSLRGGFISGIENDFELYHQLQGK